ncbi:hypothetical protein [Tropicimonas aquimaris]|uniref:Uncharacterized protein n=1 Tax=Tropicimonas aquimaris TaxID=914152 RepID=A0ABW3IZ58_9RHOB
MKRHQQKPGPNRKCELDVRRWAKLRSARRTLHVLKSALVLLVIFPAIAASEDAPAGLSIELSSAEDLPGTCRMSFLILNGFAQDIDQAVY